MNCIESILLEMKQPQIGQQEEQCWKMSALCRNIFAPDRITTFTGSSNASLSPSTLSVAIALLSGIVGTALFLRAFRGRPKERSLPFDECGYDV